MALENLGLIVAILAAAFAGWSGYEAHKARLDTIESSNKTIELQKRSVDAQIQAMQLDERPFVSVQSKSLEGRKLGPGIRLAFTYKIVASGKTPAFDLQLWHACVLNLPAATPVIKDSLTKKGDPYNPLLLDEEAERTCHVNLPEDTKSFVLSGNITYRDYFKAYHRTPFCMIVVPEERIHLGRILYSEYACSELVYESD